MVEYVSKIQNKDIYITENIKDAYIYFLFFTQDNPYEYYQTARIVDKDVEFQQIDSYGKYKFYIPDTVKSDDVIVIYKNGEYNYDETKFNKVELDRFVVLEGIGD